MRKVVYYSILIVLIIGVMLLTSSILLSFMNEDNTGLNGITAGSGIAVICVKNKIFGFLDKLFSNEREEL